MMVVGLLNDKAGEPSKFALLSGGCLFRQVKFGMETTEQETGLCVMGSIFSSLP